MRKIFIPAAILSCFLAGCSDNQHGNADKNRLNDADLRGERTEQLRVNERTDPNRERRPQDIQKKVRDEKVAEDNPALYTNERTKRLEERLMEEHDIKAAQVSMTEEKVAVGLMVQKKLDPDLEAKVERIVKQMEPDKQVVVYTDEIEWNRRRDEGLTR